MSDPIRANLDWRHAHIEDMDSEPELYAALRAVLDECDAADNVTAWAIRETIAAALGLEVRA